MLRGSLVSDWRVALERVRALVQANEEETPGTLALRWMETALLGVEKNLDPYPFVLASGDRAPWGADEWLVLERETMAWAPREEFEQDRDAYKGQRMIILSGGR